MHSAEKNVLNTIEFNFALYLIQNINSFSDIEKNGFKKLLEDHPALLNEKNLINAIDSEMGILFHAIAHRHYDAVKILLENGADTACQEKTFGFTPLLMAAQLNDEKICFLLIEYKSNVNAQSKRKTSAAHYVAEIGNTNLLTKLIKSGANIDMEDDLGHTPLFYTSQETFDLLVEAGANINKNNKAGCSVLSSYITSKKIELIKKLLKLRVDPYDYTHTFFAPLLQAAISEGKSPTIFELLLFEHKELYRLYTISKNLDESDCIEKYLRENINSYIYTMDHDDRRKYIHCLSCIFIALNNAHQFNSAQAIFNEIKNVEYYHRIKSRLAIPKRFNGKSNTNDDFMSETMVFHAKISIEKQKSLRNIFSQIKNLFSNYKTCNNLLRLLDKELERFQVFLGCDFKSVKTDEYIPFYNFFKLPILPKNSALILHTHSVLLFLMIKQLQKHGIANSDVSTFIGFVPVETANKIARSNVFVEQFLMNTFLHNKHSHVLQLYLISRAIEEGEIKLSATITFLEVLAALIDTGVWTKLLDFLGHARAINSTENLGCPHRLSQFILYNNELPSLRGYWANSLFKRLVKYTRFFEIKHGRKISPEFVLGGEAIAGPIFSGSNPGRFTTADIVEYYQIYAKSSFNVNPEIKDGVMTKSNDERFLMARKIEQLVEDNTKNPLSQNVITEHVGFFKFNRGRQNGLLASGVLTIKYS